VSELLIRCSDCPRSEHITWLPLLWHATCPECAETTAANHRRDHPGHRVEVIHTPDITVTPLRRRSSW